MKNLLLLPLVLVAALSACSKAPESTAARTDGEDAAGTLEGARNILDATSDKVDEAMTAGTKALDDAIEQAEGERPAP
jgi:uncharacterized lipoprotein